MRFLRFYLSMSSLAAIASVMCLSSSTFCHSPFNKQTKCAWTLNRQQNTAFISIWSNLFYCNKVIALKTLSSFLCLFHYYHRDENARTQCHLAHDSRTREITFIGLRSGWTETHLTQHNEIYVGKWQTAKTALHSHKRRTWFWRMPRCGRTQPYTSRNGDPVPRANVRQSY